MDDPSRRSSTPGPSSADQQHDQAERLALIDPVDRPPRRTRRKRSIAAVLLIIALTTLALAPTIAGRIGKGWVERSASRSLGVGVRAERLRLSWFGPQRLEGVQIVDEALRQIADVDLKMDRSLVAIVRHRTNLGTIHLTGRMTIEQRASKTELKRDAADGLSQIQDQADPEPSDRLESTITLPHGLAADLQLDGLDILCRYRDHSEYSIKDLTGSLAFGVGRTAQAQLSARLIRGPTSAAVTMQASVAGLTSPAGVLTPEQALLNGTIDISGSHLPLSGSLGRALRAGEDGDDSFSAALELAGTMAHGTVGLDLGSASGNAHVPLIYDRQQSVYTISAEKGCTVSLASSAVGELVPPIRGLVGESLEIGSGQQFSLDAIPACTLSLDTLHIELPTSGGPLDLSGSVLIATAELGAMSGQLDETGWQIEPTTVSLSAFGADGAVRVQGVTTAQLGSQPAGEFVLNASADGLLDDRGVPVALGKDRGWSMVLGKLSGGFECNDVQSSLLDPFLRPILDRARVSLPEDIGDRFDIEVAFDDDQNRATRLWITSDNLSARAGVVLDGHILRTDSAGIRVTMDSTDAILSRILEPQGIVVGSGGAAELSIKQASVDLARFGADDVGAGISPYAGLVDLSISPMRGTLRLEGVDRAFETSPTTMTLDARRLVDGAGLAASASLRVDGRDAGTLSVSIHADELVDARGVRLPGWPQLEGELMLRDAMVELAQPLAERSGLVLRDDIGSHLTATIQASADPDHRIQISGVVKSDHMNADAKLAIKDRVLYTADSGLVLTLGRIGVPLGRLVSDGSTFDPGAELVISIPDAVVAITDDGLDLSRSSLEASARLSGLGITAGDGQRYTIDRLDSELNIPNAGVPEIGISGSLTNAGEPVLLAGQFAVPSLITNGRFTPDTAMLDGQLDVTGWPIASEESPVGLAADADTGDLRALGAQLFGRVLDFSIQADGSSGELVAMVQGKRLIGSSRFHFRGGSLDLIGGQYTARVDPGVIEQIRLQRGQSEGVARPIGPMLVEPAEVVFAFGACTLMEGWQPKLSGQPNVKLSLTGAMTGIALRRSGETVRSGQIGLDQFVLEGRLPVGAMASAETGSALFALSGTVTGEQGTIGDIAGDLAAGFVGGHIDGPLDLNLNIASVDCGQIDDIAKLDGRVAAAAGANLDLTLEATGQAESGRIGTLNASVDLTSPRLRTDSPIRIRLEADRMELVDPVSIRWDIAPELATQVGLDQPVGLERVLVSEPIQATLRIEALSLSPDLGPFRPGVFEIGASLTAPSATVRIPGENEQDADRIYTYGPIAFSISGQSEKLTIDGSIPAVEPADAGLSMNMVVSGLAGADGVLDPERAKVDGGLVATQLPAPLVDAVLAQRGLLAEVLGPEVSVEAQANGVGADAGGITLQINATRAAGSLKGTMSGGRFVATEPGEIVVDEVRPELGGYIGRAIPVIGVVTKSKDDGPARIEINRFEIPLIGHTGKTRVEGIIADLNIKIGTARFQASSLFSTVLRAVGQRTDSQIGRRVDPIHTRIAAGVLTYDRSKIPLGEFTLESQGTYRLGDGYVDVVTYIPLAALTDQAAGSLNTGLGSLLGRAIPGLEQATMVPWRTRGMPGNLESGPDLELMAKGLAEELDPTDLINQGLDSLQDLLLDDEK